MKSLKLVVLSALCLGIVTSIYPTLWIASKVGKDIEEKRELRAWIRAQQRKANRLKPYHGYMGYTYVDIAHQALARQRKERISQMLKQVQNKKTKLENPFLIQMRSRIENEILDQTDAEFFKKKEDL